MLHSGVRAKFFNVVSRYLAINLYLYTMEDVSLAYLVLPGAVLALSGVFELSKSVVTGSEKFKLLSASNFLSTI